MRQLLFSSIALCAAIAGAGCAGGAAGQGQPGLVRAGVALRVPRAFQNNDGAQFVEYATACDPGLLLMTNGPDNGMWYARGASCTQKPQAGAVGRVDPATGTVTEHQLGKLSSPYAIASFNGQLWVSDSTTYDYYFFPHRLMWIVNTNGEAVSFSTNQGIFAQSLAPGPDGNLWYVGSTRKGKSVFGYITTSEKITYRQVPGGFEPTSIVTGPDKKIYFTDLNHGIVYRETPPSLGKPEAFHVPGNPYYLATLDRSVVWSDYSVGQLSVMDTSGKVTVYPAPPGEQPGFVARKPDGTLYFVDVAAKGGAIGSFDPATGSYGAEVSPPNGGVKFLANGSDGNMWFDDASGYVGAYLQFILTTSPASLSFGATGQTQTFAASETLYKGAFTATSANPAVATVTPVNATTFSVQSAGPGTTQILVADQQRNAVDVPVQVSGSFPGLGAR